MLETTDNINSLLSKEYLKESTKKIILNTLYALPIALTVMGDAVSGTVKECIRGSCRNEEGLMQYTKDSGDVYVLDAWFNANGYGEGCNVHFKKNRKDNYKGPMYDGWLDTHGSRDPETGRKCTNFGTFYYPDDKRRW